MPVMYIGAILAVVGSALSTTLDIESRASQYAGYQGLVALGADVQQIAFTAVPLALSPPDVSTATALVSFCNSLGPVIALTIGNILFANELSHELAGISGLSGKITGSSTSGLVDFGASVPAQFLESIRVALAVALSRTFVLAILTAGLAVCFAFGTQFLSWRSHWKSSRDRSEDLIEQGLHPNGQS